MERSRSLALLLFTSTLHFRRSLLGFCRREDDEDEGLDGYLEDKTWLVGDRCTYADLAFFMWNACIPFAMGTTSGGVPIEFKPEEFPNFTHWQNAMLARPSLQKVMSIWQSKELHSEGSK